MTTTVWLLVRLESNPRFRSGAPTRPRRTTEVAGSLVRQVTRAEPSGSGRTRSRLMRGAVLSTAGVMNDAGAAWAAGHTVRRPPGPRDSTR